MLFFESKYRSPRIVNDVNDGVTVAKDVYSVLLCGRLNLYHSMFHWSLNYNYLYRIAVIKFG
jgi:hypothetical protein